MIDLRGRAVIVTGGAGDLLRATSRLLLEAGARVALVDRSREGLERAARELEGVVRELPRDRRPPGPRPIARVEGDATREEDVRRAFDEGEAGVGPLTDLVNGAGIFSATPIKDLPVAEWDRLMEVNLRSAFLFSREALRRWGSPSSTPPLPAPPGGRSIVSIASLAGQVGGIVAGAHYAASKAGVISLTRSLAKQTAGLGIRVNTVNPGVIDSRMTREEFPPGRREAVLKDIPLGRLGTPEDVAGVILFLISPYAGYVHGAQISVNGGVRVE